MNNWFKRNGIHFAIIGIFFAICLFYLSPSFQGKTFGQNDVTRAESTQKEIMDYRAKDTTILWTNQLLGGMPTFQLWASYPANITTHIVNSIKVVLPDPVAVLLILLIGAYFLFNVLKITPWLAAAGAVAVAFSSYNIIYLVAGHTNQAFAIAYFAPIVAGILLTLRGEYLKGSSITALFLALEIRSNHVQMTYYLLLALIILVCFELYNAVKTKATPAFFKSIAYIAGAALLAIAVNASLLWSTYDYGKDTIRGQSNLTQHTTEVSNGLSKDYAYEYSEGVGESLTILVPNVYGGGGLTPLIDDSHITKALTDNKVDPNQASQLAQQLSSFYYWGDKTFTEGPWYFGAAVCFLFMFGLMIVKDRVKWWLLGTVILALLLSFGRNFTIVSDLFFNYFPLYNKFRAVESILVLASLCFPVLAFLAVKEAINTKDKAPLIKKLFLSLYIVGGLTLIIAIVPGLFFSFKSPQSQVDILSQYFRGDTNLVNSISSALVQDRQSLAQSDAFRSLIFILVAFGVLWAFLKQKINANILSLAFLLITLVDLWQVDKRYLNDNSFSDAKASVTPQPRDIDQFIMRDKDPDFRVLDLTKNLLQDGVSPFFYKSIGGYTAARLKRYQELIENQLSKSINHNVLDMLNTKYIITQDQKTQQVGMQRNNTACGNAWFVKSVKVAKNADEEMQAISSFDPKNVVIIDKQYNSLIDPKQLVIDTNATIALTHYNPDHMVYQSGSTTSQIAVFSEIYYDKGWKMLIDGKEQPYFRADYLLRAAVIPVGNHKIEFIFHPASYYAGEDISLGASILLVLALGGAGYSEYKKNKVVAVAKKG
jgi:hypothetical protein